MSPGKTLQPVLKMKVDELFLRWLSEDATQRLLHECLRAVQAPQGAPNVAVSADAAMPAPAPGGPGPPAAPAAPGPRPEPHSRRTRRPAVRRGGRGCAEVQTWPELQGTPGLSVGGIPTFYFPRGRPVGPVSKDGAIRAVETAFALLPLQRARLEDMGNVAKACGCPLYWKGPLFYRAGGRRGGSVSVHTFVAMWRRILQDCHDEEARFLHLLASPGCDFLEQEDFVPFLQDVVESHPGLAFLKEAPEFHSCYITTVIQRIFYAVNRSWSGRISYNELRRSHFLQVVARLEEEADLSLTSGLFCYEHVYVIYCTFRELDTDCDLLLGNCDLARHRDHAISDKMIDRIFSGAVMRDRTAQRAGKMSYEDFVWFLLSEEDKTTPTSIEYWFRCMDLDGDGALSAFELEFFYEEQSRRLRSLDVEPLPFPDCLCQMLDLVRPRTQGRITLGDLKRCRLLAPIFFDTFFNVDKYLDREQHEQLALPGDGDGPELSDWDRFAAAEYRLLVAEEAAAQLWEDGSDTDEPSPGKQQPSGLRPQRPFWEASGAELLEEEDDLWPA
ncbi:serine/threonine-protein phosphatase 2A regulatory subunit B'' subunit beta isoform X2 [Oryctolagus cuniculus]|uniref:EF-hand domain-containing protein n=1 Tax=Oryctolagus cuniculus TaxID=9986 RepID=G1SD10_RABIT|nr:serine/threonine-protein phosphatase 2A regulatory subunit B'' subunit beta isoform X2 [Oryctolagus cuniculus]